jgi:hypothetical protein
MAGDERYCIHLYSSAVISPLENLDYKLNIQVQNM